MPIEAFGAPPNGWAPPTTPPVSEAVGDVAAPPDGWAPLTTPSANGFADPADGWARPRYQVSAPAEDARQDVQERTAGHHGRVARRRVLRADRSTALRVASGTIAAILAVAAGPHRAIGRRSQR
jgi:hypothetical protein